MICKTHNKWFRAVEGCSLCNIEIQESVRLDAEIRRLEEENRNISLVLWECD